MNGYFSALRIPEGRSGKFEIRHKMIPKGTEITVVSMRDSLFQGKKAKQMVLDKPYLLHQLREEGEVWMSDHPQEINSQKEEIKRFKGNVLVGGLGIGLAVMQLEQNPKVAEITAVEISKDVIGLVKKHLPLRKSTIINYDLFKFLEWAKAKKRKFDYAYYDIWCPTGQAVFKEQILPLRIASEGIVAQKNIECWEEATMLGQIKMNLFWIIELWNEPAPIGGIVKRMNAQEFARYCKINPQEGTFLNWMREINHPLKEYNRYALGDFMAALQNPPRFRKTWGRWEIKPEGLK